MNETILCCHQAYQYKNRISPLKLTLFKICVISNSLAPFILQAKSAALGVIRVCFKSVKWCRHARLPVVCSLTPREPFLPQSFPHHYLFTSYWSHSYFWNQLLFWLTIAQERKGKETKLLFDEEGTSMHNSTLTVIWKRPLFHYFIRKERKKGQFSTLWL